jgi:Ion channel
MGQDPRGLPGLDAAPAWRQRAVLLKLQAIIVGLLTTAAVYFTFVTGLTIGYGDIVPRQALARALAIGIVQVLAQVRLNKPPGSECCVRRR